MAKPSRFAEFIHSLSGKIVALTLLPVVLFLVLLGGYVVPRIRGAILDGRRTAIRQMVDLVMTVATRFDQDVAAGRMTRETAQEKVKEMVSAMRYDQTNYFLIQGPGGVMVMHPLRPDFNGKSPEALGTTKLAAAFEKAAEDPAGGYVEYEFAKPGQTGTFPKTGFVRRFAPWGWVIATSLYVDDVAVEMRAVSFALVGISLLVSLLVGYVAVRSARRITRPLAQLVTGLQQGDLSRRIEVSSQDEIAQAAEAFNEYNGRMKTIVQEVDHFAERVASGSMELAASSVEMATTVSNIAQVSEALKEAGEGVSKAMDQVAGNVDAMAERTQATGTQAGQAVREAAQGAEAGKSAATGMSEIQDVTSSIVKAVQVIQDIARQTNLLSLNAAIEAAKAGAQGKGFAVVAEEVRKLAERSRTSALEIEELIQKAQETVGAGVSGVQATLRNLEAISTRITTIATSIQEVGGLSEKQAAVTRDVTRMMGHTNDRLAQNAASTHELSATVDEISHTAEELAKVSHGLKKVVSNFNL
ncbi:methyl-accepting chemotaxis protein [Mesoterricola silvestris]|uniref:Chemotaxis protein n=1 Tax=Mesoterricola silvestris TaxID=2927979 RepID=A0AA48GNC5_9BACT|nr:methyl-accepting chemotaxis protein [Mesoterricola silvestris]BDU72700.1 chemotaxis protein [Mesoterricola silvestris]